MRTKFLPTRARFMRTTIFLIGIGLFLTGCVAWQNAATPAPTLSPSETSPLLPDLVFLSTGVETAAERACSDPASGLNLVVSVQNSGDASTGPFVVRANEEKQAVDGGLQPGQSIELRFMEFAPEFLIRLDPGNLVPEHNENNNRLTLHLEPPPLPPECFPTPTAIVSVQSPLSTMEGHTAKALNLAFSPDGNLLASGSVDNTLRLWRVKEGRLLRTMQGHNFPILAIDFSPDGATLATGSTDGIIRTWSVSNGLLNRTLQGHAGRILDLTYSPDGKTLASSADDFTVRIWNPADGRMLKTIDEGMAIVTNLAYSPDGKLLVWVEGDGSLRVWRIADSAWVYHLHNLNLPATSLAISNAGDMLAVGYGQGQIQLWSLLDGRLLYSLAGHRDTITGLAFSPDGQRLISSSKDGLLRLWSILSAQAEGSPVTHQLTLSREFAGHNGGVNALAISPNGALAASAGDDATVRLWEIPQD